MASQSASASRKRKQPPSEAIDDRRELRKPRTKRIRTSRGRKIAAPSTQFRVPVTAPIQTAFHPPPAINKVPDEALAIYLFGSGESSELGLGSNTTEALVPTRNPYLDPNDPSKLHVVQLACGGMHTVALTADNKIVTWGVNDNAALGRDTQWDGGVRDIDEEEEQGDLNPLESIPTAIPSSLFHLGTRFVQVAAGDSCSLALTDNGLVYGWGTFLNTEGKAKFGYDGKGNLVEKQVTPTLIRSLANITQIACGANHALALDKAGMIWGWGSNDQTQLGRQLFGRNRVDTLIPFEVRVCPGRIKYIASGEYHAFAIDVKDNVWAWGLNSFGEAGYAEGAGGDSALAPYPMKIRELCGKGVTVLDGGAHHSAAITGDGQCLMWGRIDGGQLGIEFTEEQLSDTSVVRRDERDKPRICLRPTAVSHIGPIVHVGCGTDHTVFIGADGSGYATGFGSLGQLGMGTDDDVDVARRVRGKDVKPRVLKWAGAGGQFSAVAADATLVKMET